MASTNDLKNGMVLDLDGQLWQVLWFQHHKPGKGNTVVRSKLKHVLSGKIIKLFANPDAKCDKCDGERKDKPVQGMTILWDLKKSGDSWEGGKILDPKKGQVYSSKAKLTEGGSKLEVRGFMGVALLGRTQVWERQ